MPTMLGGEDAIVVGRGGWLRLPQEFLERAGVTGAGAAALAAGIPRGRAWAQAGTSYPDWIPASTKPPKRGGALTRASAWASPDSSARASSGRTWRGC